MTTRTIEPIASAEPPQLDPSQGRRSTVISNNADLLVELIESEKSKVTQLYYDGLKTLEVGFKEAKAKAEATLTAVNNRVKAQQETIQELAAESQDARRIAEETQKELATLRAENERLKASLAGAGLEYVDGVLRFNDDTARVVEDFVTGARVQDEQLTSLLGSNPSPTSEDALLFNPVGPAEFFRVLAAVLEKGRRFAEDIRQRNTTTPAASAKPLNIQASDSPPQSPTEETSSSTPTIPTRPIENGKRAAPSPTPSSPTKQRRTS
ncbi:hypothetical protein BDZ97DRAFT_1759247 [Flammula alnicola]|nr:hypothetical protein BDZ97DRAFT_1759247 [Flammula alnicola]